MLREIRDASFGRRLSPIGWRWFVLRGGEAVPVTWGSRRFRALATHQTEEPVALFAEDRRTYWLFEDRFYWEDEELTSGDVLALVRERERRRRRRLERAHTALAAEGEIVVRRAIPREVRLVVWERDGGRCVECGSAFEVQYDHVIPLALGGASTAANLQILCADCNRRKGAGLN